MSFSGMQRELAELVDREVVLAVTEQIRPEARADALAQTVDLYVVGTTPPPATLSSQFQRQKRRQHRSSLTTRFFSGHLRPEMTK